MVRFRQNKAKKAEKDTRVVVEGLKFEEIELDKFLFLRKPSGTTLPSMLDDTAHESEGYILLDGPFQRTIFIGGIFIRKEKETLADAPSPGFHYGYSLPSKISINRDRTLVDDEKTLAARTFDIWKRAFKSTNSSSSSQALRLYMDLFEKQKQCSDIQYARANLSDNPDIAKLLFKELKSWHGPNCWFYDGDGDNATADERIIRRSLDKEPKRIPSVIWQTFVYLDIVMSAEQARRKAFGDSAASDLGKGGSSAPPFIQHTLHLFKCFLSLHLRTRRIAYEFKACGKHIDIDILLRRTSETLKKTPR
ncbi:hypothetical protein GYMLUDRAFT_843465 [Collybiopsis luxurians FD-317 M1]|uniref:Uncharacterized protein n=1 Tax=Collybiopsis luxurians FD-317 M1 TaxID=944289 RepID=A0A0D0CK02_9AGAR|nr:hypothetical protein GYMLUDRAFT_843465 [Collybiopsis luxurians FD-317 M1]